MKYGRCETCKHGAPAMDGKKPYVVCAILPPKEMLAPDEKGVQRIMWVRPPMSIKGWCGQYKLGLLRWLGYGARA